MRKETLWEAQVRANPGHSQWYIDRFAALRAEGADLHGEARLIDAMLQRGAAILDAGCGPGRVGGELAARGHRVTGVDVDPVLVNRARTDFPNARWEIGDLSELDLPEERDPGFDLIVCAGNVLTFLAEGTSSTVLERFAAHLAPTGRLVTAFGTARGYAPQTFLADAAAANLVVDSLHSTWDLRPYTEDSDFLVAILSPAGVVG